MKSICVFAGSKNGRRPSYAEAARELGKVLTEKEISLVYGGGADGLMAEIANSVLTSGGTVVGVIAEETLHKERPHGNLTKLLIMRTLAERKAEMMGRSDAFIALPGGIGTLEEFAAVFTGRLMNLHTKPLGLLNIDSYFDPIIAFIDRIINEGFMKHKYRQLLVIERDSRTLLEILLKNTKLKV